MTLLGFSAAMMAQPQLPGDPSAARFVYDDIDRLVRTLERITAGAPPAATIASEYFARGTSGLKALISRKGVTADALATDIIRQPPAYAIMATLPRRLARHEPAIRRSLTRLKELHPAAVFPPVYYMASDPSFGGGLADPAGVLIAFGPRGYEEILDRIPHLVAHELAHVQQAMTQGVEQYRSIYGPSGSLLAIAIREGSADFIAQLTSGGHVNPRAHVYGLKHEAALWQQFQKDMNGAATGEWMFVTPANGSWPQDLGYFVGYRIAESYYLRAADKARALRDILSVTDYRTFLKDSAYNPQ